MAVEIPRRKFLAGLIGLVAAPAIVRASSLMPVRRVPLTALEIVNDALCWIGGDDVRFLEGMMQRIEQMIIYGNPDFGPATFTGLQQFSNDLSCFGRVALYIDKDGARAVSTPLADSIVWRFDEEQSELAV